MSASPPAVARSEAASGWFMVSPTLIYAVLLLAAPLVTIVAYSFFKDGYLVVVHEFTTQNYIDAWSDPIFRTILLRSVLVSALVTLVTVLLAFPIAYFISFNVPAAHKSRWLFLITIPFWTSYLIRVFQWKVILNFNGVVNSTLMGLGVIDSPLQMLNSVGAIAITLAHAYAPFAILPIFVSLEKIDRSLLEAGQDLGESRLMTFWRVTLPLAMPGVIGAVMIVFIPTIGDYVTPELIGGGKLPMVANLIQKDMLKIDNKPLGAAVAVSAMLVVSAVALIFLFLNRRFLRGGK
ncbi:polyamine ABC transporter, permease protein PotH-1 [Rhodobacter capsulatus SB 1003]|uniref:Polyamine ABC transporter, permease protein PotH-1 n=1 Tax=Rhodobacter capsulatus (strain ATCC BAA-309 / NBRC 16581 / SB1003) TaxID=272942 RepID=D5AUK1_RHOCB|nr:ABC transporter permease [Rhodobacter capsulatus]ADE85640.1 polyamine ABC transporter, permease protein PotH-1 [Rhodobacter capsulatus SB 1003]